MSAPTAIKSLLDALDRMAPTSIGSTESVIGALIGYIPIWRVDLKARLTYRKQIGPLPEFTLRFISSGINSRVKLAQSLAIPEPMFIRLVDHLLDEGWISRIPGAAPSYAITPLGTRVMDTLETAAATERILTIDIDPINSAARLFDDELLSFGDLQKDEDRVIIFSMNDDVEYDLTSLNSPIILPQILRIANDTASGEDGPIALRGGLRLARFDSAIIGEAIQTQIFYKSVPIILIEDLQANNAFFRVCNGWDFKESRAHTEFFLDLLKKGNSLFDICQPKENRIPIEGLDHQALSKVIKQNIQKSAELQKKRQALRDLEDEKARVQSSLRPELGGALASAFSKRIDKTISDQQIAIAKMRDQIPAEFQSGGASFRILSTKEHGTLLLRALKEAKREVIIISPWLRRNALTKPLIHGLESAIERGVALTIGYGIDNIDESRTQEALSSLQHLVHKGLKIRRLGNSHDKLLICDESFAVVTSFNWLSFRPWPGYAMRDETGLYTEDSKVIKSLATMLYERLKQAPAPN